MKQQGLKVDLDNIIVMVMGKFVFDMDYREEFMSNPHNALLKISPDLEEQKRTLIINQIKFDKFEKGDIDPIPMGVWS